MFVGGVGYGSIGIAPWVWSDGGGRDAATVVLAWFTAVGFCVFQA